MAMRMSWHVPILNLLHVPQVSGLSPDKRIKKILRVCFSGLWQLYSLHSNLTNSLHAEHFSDVCWDDSHASGQSHYCRVCVAYLYAGTPFSCKPACEVCTRIQTQQDGLHETGAHHLRGFVCRRTVLDRHGTPRDLRWGRAVSQVFVGRPRVCCLRCYLGLWLVSPCKKSGAGGI
jgi:hypothetical protein